MDFNDSKTKECVARSFAGLCQDGARYRFIAKSASDEGFYYISRIMEKIAALKMAHAGILYKIMLEQSKKRRENVNIEAGYPFENQILKTSLQDSAEIEKYQFKNVYPHFAKIAADEGFAQIADVFTKISKVGERTCEMLTRLADKFDNKRMYKSDKIELWECGNCGYFEKGKTAWTNCPLCGYGQGYVKLPK